MTSTVEPAILDPSRIAELTERELATLNARTFASAEMSAVRGAR